MDEIKVSNSYDSFGDGDGEGAGSSDGDGYGNGYDEEGPIDGENPNG